MNFSVAAVLFYEIDIETPAPDCHARKTGAIIEGFLAYARHAVGDYYACKPCATIEGIIADARHAAPDCHACQLVAMFEGR